MPAKATIENSDPVLKRLFPDGVEKVVYSASRLFERCKKDTKFTNADVAVVVRISGTSGGSAHFPSAVETQGQSQKARFIVNRKREYQVWSLDGELIAATGGDPKAIVNAVKDEAEEAGYKLSRTMARRVTGGGGGALGVISSDTNVATTTLKFSVPTDVQWIEKGDWLQFSDLDGTSASADPSVDIRGGQGARLQVSSVNRQAGTCVLSAALNTISGVAVGDYVFRYGDYSRAMTGIEGWLPFADPTSDLFFGVNRTAYDMIRISGYRYTTGAGGSYGDAIVMAGAEAATHGINDLDALYMSSIDFGKFVLEVGEQRLRTAEDSKVGYKFIEVATQCANGGMLKVIQEPGLRTGYAWMLKDSELEFSSAGAFPSSLDHGTGNKGMQVPQDDDALQGRMGGYGNFKYRNPGKGVIIQLASAA